MKMDICEHELSLVDENWISENSVMATAKCQKCGAEFEGLMIKK